LWLVAVGGRELENGREAEARNYFDKAKSLGLPQSEYAAFEERVKLTRRAARADAIRGHMLRGERDQAEVMLVEWEAEDPRNPTLKNLKKEFDRMEGMVTIASGSVAGRQVDAFNIDIFETTNKEFLEFVRANPEYQRGGKQPKALADGDYLSHWTDTLRYSDELENRPVVFISQPIADAYCKWRKKRLPTSDEWGLAAGEGRRKYPWGNQAPTTELANFGNPFGKPEPGEAYPQGRTPEGVYNMAGNVWEITSTKEGGLVVARGGCYFDQPEFREAGYRGTRTRDRAEYTSRFMGVRCAQ
ncbi:MAG TPA: SUMF1/EgtB/PvdO family nonheme iron enzyme, partial [bacterium]